MHPNRYPCAPAEEVGGSGDALQPGGDAMLQPRSGSAGGSCPPCRSQVSQCNPLTCIPTVGDSGCVHGMPSASPTLDFVIKLALVVGTLAPAALPE